MSLIVWKYTFYINNSSRVFDGLVAEWFLLCFGIVCLPPHPTKPTAAFRLKGNPPTIAMATAACVDCYFIARIENITLRNSESQNCVCRCFAVEISFQPFKPPPAIWREILAINVWTQTCVKNATFNERK